MLVAEKKKTDESARGVQSDEVLSSVGMYATQQNEERTKIQNFNTRHTLLHQLHPLFLDEIASISET
jgi:hypothetical protein